MDTLNKGDDAESWARGHMAVMFSVELQERFIMSDIFIGCMERRHRKASLWGKEKLIRLR